ncbi:flagellin (plasmid) [Rossellomorea sp. AcN35-11]|nr:flagellin [Rossellomorea sp. AcN35-11]
MRINHNIAALNTFRQLNAANAGSSKSMEKLSSGLRINKAGDDAAGLAISEKMRGQIRGLEQASRNSQDGISLIQTAEGALNESHSILQRMRELAVQSSNDTNTGTDRAELQKEVDELSKELTRIGETTEFNTKSLIDGSFNGSFQIGANEGQSIDLSIGDMRGFNLGVAGEVQTELTAAIGAGVDTTAEGAGAEGTYTIDGTDLKNEDGTVVGTTGDGGVTWTGNGAGALGDDVLTFTNAVDSGEIKIDSTGAATGTAEFANNGLQAGDYSFDFAGGTLSNASGDVVATTADSQNFVSVEDGVTNVFSFDACSNCKYESKCWWN